MQWTEDLAVGNEMIDTQHKELFRRIGALVESVKKKECKFTIGGTTQFLEEYVVKHFSEEEALMQSKGYPALAEHQGQHEQFIADFRQLKEDLANEPSSYTRSVYTNQIVVDWIINHIQETDKKFGRYLRGEG